MVRESKGCTAGVAAIWDHGLKCCWMLGTRASPHWVWPNPGWSAQIICPGKRQGCNHPNPNACSKKCDITINYMRARSANLASRIWKNSWTRGCRASNLSCQQLRLPSNSSKTTLWESPGVQRSSVFLYYCIFLQSSTVLWTSCFSNSYNTSHHLSAIPWEESASHSNGVISFLSK